MTHQDFRFEEEFGSLLAEVRRHARERHRGRMDSQSFCDAIEAIGRRMRSLEAPNADWQALRDRMALYLAEQAALYRRLSHVDVPPEELLAETGGLLQDIEADYRRLQLKARRLPGIK